MPILACVGLLLVAAAQLALPVRTVPPEDSGLAPRRLRMPIAPITPEYPAILRAPLFAPNRAPGEAPGAAGGGGGWLQVLGVAGAGATAAAVVRGADGKNQVLQVGESLGGLRLAGVTPGHALFDGPSGRTSLPVDASPPPAAAPSTGGDPTMLRSPP